MYVNLNCQTEKTYFMNVSFIRAHAFLFVCFLKKGGGLFAMLKKTFSTLHKKIQEQMFS